MSSEIVNLTAVRLYMLPGGRDAQTCPHVHVSSPAYERHICSATCRRNI